MNYKAKVLCYGDSNTFGYDPRGILGYRYPAEHRWVDLLAGYGYKAINEGLNGREFPTHENGYKGLEVILKRNLDSDFLTIMLGTNDLYSVSPLTTESIINRIDMMYKSVGLLKQFNENGKKTILICPPAYEKAAYGREDVVPVSKELGKAYEKYAKKSGLHFADASKWGIDMALDGDHFSEIGHERFAKMIADTLDTLLD